MSATLPSDLGERLRLLEEKIASLESGSGVGYGAARHNSLAEQGPGAQTEVTDTTEDHHQTQLANKDTIPKVRRCNFMQFKNRFTDEDGRYAIDVLLSGALFEQEMHEELQFRERRSSNAAAASSRSGSLKSKDSALKAKNISNNKALEKAQSHDVWIHRVRLQSPAILKILANIQGESWSSRPRTYLRPFLTIVSFHSQMKKALRELESRWAPHLDGGATPATPMTSANTNSPGPTDGGMEEPEEAPVDNCPEALAAMRCYVKFVDDEIIPEFTQFDGLKASDNPRVRFSDLHYLFRTGELVCRPYGSDDWKRTGKRLWRCYGLRSREANYRVRPSDHRQYDIRQDDAGEKDESFIVKMFYLEYTGEEFCTVTTELAIQPFTGLRRVRSLPVYPVRFGPDDVDEYLADAAELGEKTLEYIDLKHVSYDSWTVTRTPKGEPIYDAAGVELKHPEYINSDVMVDFSEAFQANPHWKPKRTILRPEPVEQLAESDEFAILWWSGPDRAKLKAESCEVVPVRTGVSAWEQNKFVSTYPLLSQMTENLAKGQLTTKDYLSPLDKGLIACRVFGYVFQDRKFAQMDVSNMSRPSGSRDALDSLRIPHEVKDMIQRSVQGHLMQKADERQHGQARGSQDFIRGKGAGLFILLHGVPGVGKTATVEAIAQTHGKPLFKITCGDLGLTPEQVEAALGGIFRLADSWDCILLMDEVDTFFSQRSKGDAAITKNALVSVFLRILDYYTGILFMTTNRVGALDEAFRSRIHYNILYPPLNRQQAREIWEINLRRLQRIDAEHQSRAGRPPMEIAADEILRFAEQHFIGSRSEAAQWNGRQIRNAFQVVRSLAYADAAAEAERLRASSGSSTETMPPAPRLLVKHFELMDRVTVDFEDYMKAVFSGQTAADLARETEHRADRFAGQAWTTSTGHHTHHTHGGKGSEFDEGEGHGDGNGNGIRPGGDHPSASLLSGGRERPSRGTVFRSGNRARHLEPPPPPQYQGRRGLSPSRVEYPHSPTNNGPLPGQLQQPEAGGYPAPCPSPGRRNQASRLAVTDTVNDSGWGRPVSPGADRVLFVNNAGRSTVPGDYAGEVRPMGRYDEGEYEQGYGDSKNEYGKRERSAW